jgi:crossover junction endodeoxyribonuclease RuvC
VRRPKSLAELGLADPADREIAGTARVPSVRTVPSRSGTERKRPLPLPANVRVLGLDPGSLRTGYAVVEVSSARVSYVVSGAIRARGESLAERLQEIFAGVDRLTNEFRPDEVAIERVFMHRNADSALKLGQARGAALSATFAVRPRVFEYAAREVKLAVVGTGGAQKEQVQLMVRRLLRIAGPVGADAADALAIALCHAHSRRLYGLAGAAQAMAGAAS